MNPTDRKYSKEHEWVVVNGDQGRVGITKFAQNELGDIVYVELPEVGAEFAKGEVIGTIESVKAVSEIYAPVSGSIVEVNEALTDAPDTVNSDPFGKGWYCGVRFSEPSELAELMDAAAYDALIAT